MFIISVDADFFETMDLQFLEGDPELINKASAGAYTYVLNAAARQHIGWEQALGKMFSVFGNDGRGAIAGVTEDFNFQSLHNTIKPCVMVIGDISPTQLYLKIASSDIQATLTETQHKIAGIIPALSFEFTFLDEEFAHLYATEQQAQKVISFYTWICLLLAVFGLYGLLSFEVSERMKEISIRKVLGASFISIINLLSKGFLKLVGVAALIAIPMAWYFMHRWLENFVYRINLDWWVFGITVLGIIVVTLLVVSVQSLKAVLVNPVASLRSE